jgi:KUP system potassium uptake protein
MQEQADKNQTARARYLLFLAITAIGVVFGDIGTSPLYALRVCFYGPHAVSPTHGNVFGVLSLIFWSLILVVSIKYLALVLRADNQGEGGILALMALVLPKKGRQRAAFLFLGLFGAALLYGDGCITPAISVLSAIEGLSIAAPVFTPFVVPLTLVVLFFLFLVQHRGTGRIGLMFGPVMVLWFLILGGLGLINIIFRSEVLAAVNPIYAFRFLAAEGYESLFIIGAIFLVVTGAEALYADLGHFGRAPIRLTWFALILPCLLLNYFGQGALILDNPSVAVNPFYHMAPAWALYPLVVIATAATIIASQAVISGVFSLTFQAVQLGYLPRLQILHTSEGEQGQIFLRSVNWLLFAATAAIVLGFRSSGSLAAAYGVAVSMTMVITTILVYGVLRERWLWPLWIAAIVAVIFLMIDLAYFGANLMKIGEGGWFPLIVAAFIYLLMSTWTEGRRVVSRQIRDFVRPLKSYLKTIDPGTVKKVPGTAVYLAASPFSTPPAFVHNVRHNKIMHERILFLYVGYKNVPHVSADSRVSVKNMIRNVYRVVVRYGFMDRTDIRAVVRILDNKYLKLNMEDTTFFVGRDTFIPTRSVGMSKWRGVLYQLMRRNSARAFKYFNLPSERVLEIGAQVKI